MNKNAKNKMNYKRKYIKFAIKLQHDNSKNLYDECW